MEKNEVYIPDAGETGKQIFKFIMFSVSAGIVETISFTVLKIITPWGYWPCYLPALILSVLWNFTWNREFTFKSANNVPIAMVKVFLFYCVFTPASTWWGNALSTRAGWNDYLVLAFTMAINLTSEFIYDRFVVYGNSMNTNKRAKKQAQVAENVKKENGDE